MRELNERKGGEATCPLPDFAEKSNRAKLRNDVDDRISAPAHDTLRGGMSGKTSLYNEFEENRGTIYHTYDSNRGSTVLVCAHAGFREIPILFSLGREPIEHAVGESESGYSFVGLALVSLLYRFL